MSVYQPMDQAILLALKKKYYPQFLNCLVSGIYDSEDCVTSLKKISVLDIVTWTLEEWEEIPSISLVQAWKILLDYKVSDKWEDFEK